METTCRLLTRSFNCFYLACGTGVKYCCQRVCLFVRLFVCPLAYLKQHTSKFYQIFGIFYLWSWLGLFRLQYNTLCTSGLVDDVSFLCNRPIRSESKTSRMFHPFCRMAAPGAKSAVSDYVLSPNGRDSFVADRSRRLIRLTRYKMNIVCRYDVASCVNASSHCVWCGAVRICADTRVVG